MKTHDADRLRRDLQRHGRARGKPVERELRERVVEFAENRRREGASWMTIADEIGASFDTVRRWCRNDAGEGRALRRVEVIAEPIVAASRTSFTVVTTPGGLRIEGATLDEVVALERALR